VGVAPGHCSLCFVLEGVRVLRTPSLLRSGGGSNRSLAPRIVSCSRVPSAFGAGLPAIPSGGPFFLARGSDRRKLPRPPSSFLLCPSGGSPCLADSPSILLGRRLGLELFSKIVSCSRGTRGVAMATNFCYHHRLSWGAVAMCFWVRGSLQTVAAEGEGTLGHHAKLCPDFP
jgi:hypothetical protein